MRLRIHQGFWNGEPSSFRVVIGYVGATPAADEEHYKKFYPGQKRYLWYVPFIGQERQMVEVIYNDGQAFYLDNMDGSGLYKVTSGMGSPQCGHKSIYPSEIQRELLPTEWQYYDEELHKQLDKDIEAAWMKLDPEGYPEHKKRIAALKRVINRSAL